MELKQYMKFYFLVLISNLLISGCSDDDPEPGCFQEEGRRIVATITNEEGTIRRPGTFCPDDFTIEPDIKVDSRPLGSYAPCNLTNDFEFDNARILFSGFVYESFETEDICADFFEITEIRFISP